MTRVVVTGATGFIGRHLINRLVRVGMNGSPAQVVAIARRPEALPASTTAVEVHALDLAEASPESIAAACGRDAVVFHLAASAAVGGGEAAYRNNVQATERLIEALRSSAPRRVVYASSIGAVDRLPSDPCTAPLDENSPPHPLTRYGASKLAGERLLAASGLPFSIIRPTWVYGPGMREDSHLRVFLQMVRQGKPIARFRFPGRVSVIHVDDLCSALLLAAQQPAALGQTYFAADGEPAAIGTLFGEFGEITGRAAGDIAIPSAIAGIARAARRWLPLAAQGLHSDVLLAGVERLRALGFTPSVPRRRGLIELARSSESGGGRWIVTGAASGIGRAFTVQLYAAGHRVVAVDRDATGLDALHADCPEISTHAADLSTDDGQRALVSLIESVPCDGLVNCAGIGTRGDVREVSSEAQSRLLEVNTAALARACTHAARQMSAQAAGGTIVNVASSAAVQPLPGMAAYAASKAFVLSYSEALAEELAQTPVQVITICPGGTDTGFQAASGVRRVEGERLMPAHQVAAVMLRAAARRESATVFVGARTQAMALLARFLPRRVMVRLWGRLMRQMR
ncbi:MAG: SDR family NAD(P)-dependent oxidoreductase [Gemmatimonadetes bacterium]|nr:SDR family NAD(P)-dependent oxidoreductase [Gemmatimonadota bacterium]